MNIITLVQKLNSLGIKIRIIDGELKVRASKDNLSSEIIDEIKINKQELLSFYKKKNFVTIPKAKAQEYYPLSSAQKRLYLLQEMEQESTAYNMPYIISLGAEVEVVKEKIEKTFNQLISRHESFRTSFEIVGEELVQHIHVKAEFKIEEFSIEKDEVKNQRHQFIQPFDLSKVPLLRVSKVDVKGEGSLLMIDMHHIISDGVSHAILEQDLQRLYSGEQLPPLRLQYKDYSQWQNSEEYQERVKKQEDYWIRTFEGEIPVLYLPTDYVRPVIQSHEGATVSFTISKEETQHIKSLAKENGLTLYMSVLSVFAILLSKLSGQEDIIVGTPIAGRNHSDLENIVGIFINTLAIRNKVNGSNSLREFIGELKQTTLEAFENQDYQFEDLVEKVSVERDISRNPLFDVMFNLLNHANYSGDLSDFANNQYVHTPDISKFDLGLSTVDYGDQLLFNFVYCTKLFRSDTIERFIRYFKQIVNQIKQKIDNKISEIDIISSEEKQQLLYEFNDTKIDYPRDKTIHQLFEEQVSQSPDCIAVVYNNQSISFKELNLRSNQLAQLLLSKGLKPEDIVGILVDRSIEMIIGVLGILKAGGTYLPLDIESPKERINYIIKESRLRIILSQDSVYKNIELEEEYLDLFDSSLYLKNPDQNISQGKASNAAYIIYTSGSTGKPKGVIVEHGNVVNLINGLIKSIYDNYHETLNISLISPIFFDASVKQIFPSLTLGHSLNIIPDSIRFEGSALVSYYSKHDIQIADGTPFHAQMLTQYVDEKTQGLNIRQFILGGDELKLELMQSLFQKISVKDLKISNVYGPTECTDVTTIKTSTVESLKEKGNISIGKPISNYEIFILGKNLELLPVGVSGELCISGEGVSRGYLFNKELTLEKFIEHPYKKGARLYKTGDLARWLPDGDIEFLGRIDHQVKIRGFRIELGEIENVLLKHESIKESVVLAREENGDKYLCAYVVATEEFNQEEIRTHLSASLPDYMIPAYFVAMDEIPLTPNGKVNRKALPSPEIKAGDNYVAPSNAIEEKLVEIWSAVLNIEKEAISTTASFFTIGGHSLKASILTGRIHKETGVEFPLRDVFLHSTVREQARQINTRDKKDFVSIPKAKPKEYYSLSSAQKRLYLLQEMEPDSTTYNMPYIIPLGAEAEKEKIAEAFRQLIKRHESFRTSFEIVAEEPIQRIHEQVEFKIEELTITKEEVQEKRQQFIQAFDLSQAPLLRVSKLDIKGEGSLLMIDMHHIISDGVSHEILEQDFQRLYSGEELSSLSLQYKDYSEWQNSEEQQIKVKEQEEYWIRKFEGEIPVLNLPVDYVRPIIQSHEGASVSFALSKEETRHIKLLAKENGLTLYMSVLSVFSILLSKLSRQEDIIIGTPIAGRNHTDVENIVGMFVNTLAIRNEVNGNNTLKEFIKKLKQSTLEAFENQDYQFEDLVENVSVERNVSRNPLFDVMFNLLNHADYSGDLSDLGNDQYVHTSGISKFDLGLSTVDYGDQLSFNLSYCTKLFKADTIERFISYFKQIINQITQKIDHKISELDIISSEEKQQLLYDFNNTKIDYPRDKTIHELFEEQAERSPDSIALVYNNQRISYRELNKRSNPLAQLLLSKGLKPEDIVGILVDRSIEMIIGVLGILKAGGTYLPLDIESPKDRINYIIEESKLRIILSQEIASKEIIFQGELLDLFEPSLYLNNPDQNISQGKSSDSAYIIYTSGSTGKPKGVIVEHRNVVNLINGLAKSIYDDYHETLHVSLISPIFFDASVKQIFPSLALGHILEIIPDSIRFEGSALVNYYTKHDIQIADGTPFQAQMLTQYVDEKTQGLNIRQFILGGDELKLELMQSLFQKISVKDLKISNAYGPTECTDVTTIKTSTVESLKEKGNTSIGKPISNYEIFILGKNLELLPVGVSGELCISGAGVSRGYLFNEALTSEKFIEHPYKNGERLYRTGDLARWLVDGNIEFLGRIDHQVKIRGFRIELGEIENVLLKHENIKESVVLAREENGDKYLCAYIVAKEEFNQEEIRAHLSASLPGYMIPAYFVAMDEIPLTTNGKVNRKALSSPEIKVGGDYVAPSNATEEKLVEIWSGVLNIEREVISTTANFFAIGGHSLKAVILASRIHALYDVDIKIKEIFSYPTIKDLAKIIEASEMHRLEEEIEEVDYENLRI